jgi:hypothetical protein
MGSRRSRERVISAEASVDGTEVMNDSKISYLSRMLARQPEIHNARSSTYVVHEGSPS